LDGPIHGGSIDSSGLEVFGQFWADGPERLTDPFERQPDGLFLAESFARLDFLRHRKLRD
jgi:hypothetical protein